MKINETSWHTVWIERNFSYMLQFVDILVKYCFQTNAEVPFQTCKFLSKYVYYNHNVKMIVIA